MGPEAQPARSAARPSAGRACVLTRTRVVMTASGGRAGTPPAPIPEQREHSSRLRRALDHAVESLAMRSQVGMGLCESDVAERDALAGLDLADAVDVERAQGGDLRVPSGGLAIPEQHDGLAVSHPLDSADRHAVGDDVVAANVLDEGPLEASTQAVALRRHLVRPGQEGRDAARGEAIVLGPEHDADLDLRPVLGPAIKRNTPRPYQARRAERQAITLRERAAVEAAEPPADIRRPRATHRPRVDAPERVQRR